MSGQRSNGKVVEPFNPPDIEFTLHSILNFLCFRDIIDICWKWRCCGKKCDRAGWAAGTVGERKDDRIMKVAVTYENGNVFPHFGHTEQFKVYEVEEGKVAGTQVVDTDGSGHGALAGMLKALKVDTLICGGIGAGAQTALAEADIRLYGGVSGSADEAVEALLAGKLAFDPDVRCDHHGNGHEEGHHHGNGHCGEDKHGCSGNGGGCYSHTP